MGDEMTWPAKCCFRIEMYEYGGFGIVEVQQGSAGELIENRMQAVSTVHDLTRAVTDHLVEFDRQARLLAEREREDHSMVPAEVSLNDDGMPRVARREAPQEPRRGWRAIIGGRA